MCAAPILPPYHTLSEAMAYAIRHWNGTDPLFGVCVSPCGTMVASCGGLRIQLYRLRGGSCLRSQPHFALVELVEVSACSYATQFHRSA